VNGRNTKDRGPVPGLLGQSRWKSKQYHIYALADPRDHLVRYIGITTDTKYRYRQLVETINRAAETSDDAFKQIVSEREAYWIGEYLRLGAPLFNTFGVTKRYPRSRLEETPTSLNDPVGEGLTTNKKRQEKRTRAQEEILSIK
jgi:hypothetical protein